MSLMIGKKNSINNIIALVAEFGFGAQNPESRRAQPKVVWTDKVRGGSNPS